MTGQVTGWPERWRRLEQRRLEKPGDPESSVMCSGAPLREQRPRAWRQGSVRRPALAAQTAPGGTVPDEVTGIICRLLILPGNQLRT